jgi:Kef-type K+ transport system membrane component KefB
MLRRMPSAGVLFLAAVLLFPAIAFAGGEDPSIPLLLYLVAILVTAKLMGHLAVVLRQPAVLGGEKVIGAATYSAVVIMVIVTTLVAPPLLKWTLTDRKAAPPHDEGA